jgi:phosphoenolpyruvate synthase/pyruvate phosphate dikinase
MRNKELLTYCGAVNAVSRPRRLLSISGELYQPWPGSLLRAEIGGKAYGLTLIAHAELETPAALVLPVSAFEEHIAALGIDKQLKQEVHTSDQLAGMRRAIQKSEMAPLLVDALLLETSHLREPFAVRSSSVVEDAPDASWAGQFDTLLGVSRDALPRSVLRGWSSVFTETVMSYASDRGVRAASLNMAIVVQELIRPVWAGVAFGSTMLNKSYNSDRILVEAIRGLGGPLVDGSRSPEYRAELSALGEIVEETISSQTHRWSSARRENLHPPHDALVTLADGIAALSEFMHSTKLDVEWAWDGRHLWFLQVRRLLS